MGANLMDLELGAGNRPTPGWVHNDAREMDDIEIVWPAEDIAFKVGEEACDNLRATHLLEHFSHREVAAVLANWRTALKPGGVLYLEVPNLMWQARALAMGLAPQDEVITLMYGDQDYVGNFHKTGFTMSTLRQSLEDAGFEDVQVQDIGQVLVAQGRKSREE